MRSGFERTVASHLDTLKVRYGYETMHVPYITKHIYTPDLILENGVIIEVKGRFMRGDTAKMKAVKEQHPHLDLRFVFMYADKKIPGQKQTHEQWAERHGFPWAVGKVPEEWLISS